MANLGLPGPSNALEPWIENCWTNWVVEFHFLPCRELLKAMVFSWGALPPCAGQMKRHDQDLYLFFSRYVSKLFKRPWRLSVLQEVVSNRISRKFGEQEVLNKLSSWAAFDFWCCQSSHHCLADAEEWQQSDNTGKLNQIWSLIVSWPNFGHDEVCRTKVHILSRYSDSCVFVRECGKNTKCRGILWAANQSKDGFVWKSQTVAF